MCRNLRRLSWQQFRKWLGCQSCVLSSQVTKVLPSTLINLSPKWKHVPFQTTSSTIVASFKALTAAPPLSYMFNISRWFISLLPLGHLAWHDINVWFAYLLKKKVRKGSVVKWHIFLRGLSFKRNVKPQSY